MAWANVERLESWLGNRWSADVFFGGLREAVRLGNPALWIPVVLMAATGALLLTWMKLRRGVWLCLLMVVWLCDLASVVSTADVNSGWMTARDLVEPPVLARKIHELDPRGTGRLLVPRYYFEGHRPLDMLSPSTNVIFDVPTFTSYGPLWPAANRLLFRMAPWGASESIVELMRNTRLMRAMGIRFVAVRSEAERELFHRATVAPVDEAQVEVIEGSEEMVPVPWQEGIFWPVRVEEPGLYQLSFSAERHGQSSSRWFVSLEDEAGTNLDRTRSIDPVDLSEGKRELHFLFYADRGVGAARVRIKSESGVALHAGRARFGRVGQAIHQDGEQRRADAVRLGYRHAGDLVTESQEAIALYELEGAVDLVYWAEECKPEYTTMHAVARLTDPENWDEKTNRVSGSLSAHFYTLLARDLDQPQMSRAPSWERPRPDEVIVRVNGGGPGLLIFNETYDKGWHAFVDGVEWEIWPINAVVQGVGVPEGTREVRFVYRNPGLKRGAAISLLGWGGLVAGGMLFRRRKDRK